jgi:hypothetical protein
VLLKEERFKMTPQLIVMLTHNDRTVADAIDIYENCKNAPCNFWGYKEEGLPVDKVINYMKN